MIYGVVYVQNEVRKQSDHRDHHESFADFEDMRQIDRLEAFDDRFASNIEGMSGKCIHS